jgi:hypothetical protein
MFARFAGFFVALVAMTASAAPAEQVVVTFERGTLFSENDKANRFPEWVEKGVAFRLAHEPRQSKAKGLLMFFAHLSTGRKGLVCAMAAEPIPVRATFPKPASSVTVSLWGSTGVPAVLEAFDQDGKLVDRASLASAPGRKSPGDPAPIFTLTVNAARIVYVEFSGPREGEYLAADEVRFTPIDEGTPKRDHAEP